MCVTIVDGVMMTLDVFVIGENKTTPSSVDM